MNTVKWIGLFLIASFISLFFVSATNAEPLITLDAQQSKYTLSPDLEILEDVNQDITFEQISSGMYDDDFLTVANDTPNFGYTTAAYWTKFTIQNNSDSNNWLLQISYPPLDQIRLYTPDRNGNYIVKETGDLSPFSSREIPHRDFVFRLDLPPDSMQTFYLQIITEGSAQMPIVLSTGDTFHNKSLLEYLVLGIYYGMGLIMVIYNLFLFFSLRLSSYFWYTLLVIAILGAFFTLNGLSYQYLWSDASWWNNRAILFFMTASYTITLMFTKTFLNTKTHTPKLNTLLNWAIGIQFILVGILLINYRVALDLIMGMMFLLVILVVLTSVISWINGIKPAKYLLFGWIIFLIGLSLSSLSDMGIIPVTFITKYASQIGSGVEIALFSLALGAKIRWLRLEKEALEKQAMQSQQLAVKHLQQANQLKDEFLANTSHELRTPLQGIIGIAESLRDREILDKEADYNLSLIIASGEKLSHLINDLLDASKLKYHDLSLDIEAVQLWKVTEVVCQVSTASYEKPIMIKNNISEELPLIAADETRLQQILYNLLSNALKYTDHGEIVISAVASNDKVKISIRDTGIGIAKDDLEVIFDSFKRGANIDELAVTGTGLGLNITRQLVALHDGEIFIESTLGEGTTVIFTVPIYNEKLHNHANVNKQKLLTDYQENFKPKRTDTFAASEHKKRGKVLLVDDEAINIHVLYSHLSLANYETVIAYDGEKALEILEQSDFDLIILDVMLPKLSGYHVAKKVRETYSLTELPILMLTSKSQTEDILTAFQSGANDYLTKPCAKEELLARVHTLISLKLMMQELTEVNIELLELNQTLETQVEERTAALEDKSQELEQINTSRKRLMTNISHELGTPMTSIKGYLKAMLDGVIELNDQKYISLVYQKVLFIERLIQDLYELARLESRQLSFNWESMDIDTFLNTCIQRYEMDVESSQHKFIFETHIEHSEENYHVIVDVNRMEHVMQNLIFNAIRFTEIGGTISIKAKLIENNNKHILDKQPNHHSLQISVCDNGAGMHQETLQHIFERFYRKNDLNNQLTTNTGLGLNIAKEIITYHHGQMWAESEQDIGSCFHFILPLYVEDQKEGGN